MRGWLQINTVHVDLVLFACFDFCEFEILEFAKLSISMIGSVHNNDFANLSSSRIREN